MSRATLLHREVSSKSLKTTVENAQSCKGNRRDYKLEIRSGNLILTPLEPPAVVVAQKTSTSDEGFESDVDSISLMSNESFNCKSQESDSANGSACSDSDSELAPNPKETFSLVNCVCYTDIKYPDTLVFVVLDEALIFKFDNLDDLQNFYSNFTTIKAITNQRVYGNPRFNLLQRTDSNGVTHIEISRQPQQLVIEDDFQPSSIISINTPDYKKSLSTENLLEAKLPLKKVWSSAENLLEERTKPIRRRQKGPAPQPPQLPPKPEPRFTFLKPKIPLTFQQFNAPWTNSMPRLIKKKITPMAYRYIDTTYLPAPPVQRFKNPSSTISNRLFGMSSKLKEFNSIQSCCNLNTKYQTKDPRYEGTLKSVIKKDDVKKKEKKVTFSAYNTVQVV